MTRPITTVKGEIRILGLDSCTPQRVIGVVVRGGLFEDGVISLPRKRSHPNGDIVAKILETKYFPELRSIMVHDPKRRLDPASIEQMTRLPIIQVSEAKPGNETGYKVFYRTRGKLWVKTRLQSLILDKILSLTWTTGLLPEPVRVAHLLAGTTIPRMLHRDKG